LFAAQGHDVRLMSPEYVRPYVKAQKNDDRDAEGIAEAATRPTMRFVETKTEAQLDMQSLHRSRDRLVGERTALINQLRAILLERGIVVPQGKRKLEQYLVMLMEEEEGRGLSARMRMLIADMRAQWLDLDRRIAAFEAEFTSFAKENEDARRLTTIPGVGVMIASALIAAIGKAETFEHGRDLAAWLVAANQRSALIFPSPASPRRTTMPFNSFRIVSTATGGVSPTRARLWPKKGRFTANAAIERYLPRRCRNCCHVPHAQSSGGRDADRA
jgi:transposase